jgi:hypothetical protein
MILANKVSFPFMPLIVMLDFGFSFRRQGKPYNGFLFNLRKHIALGGVIYAGWQYAQLLKTAATSVLSKPLLAKRAITARTATSSKTGSSAGQLDYALILLTHRIGIGVLSV